MKEIFVRQERNGQVASGVSRETASVEVPSAREGWIRAKAYLPTNFRGIGRKPGTMPPIKSIQAWIAIKRLDLNAWAVAVNIKKKGTLVYRDKRRGIDVEGVKAKFYDEFKRDLVMAIRSRINYSRK